MTTAGAARPTVAVLGGGVGGMTAAYELAKRGFAVTVLESKDIPGGKARSMPVPGSGVGGRADLPGEHGFRFFPGFYRHLPATMADIPYDGGTVADRLRDATEAEIAQAGGKPAVRLPVRFPNSVSDLRLILHDIANLRWDVSPGDAAHFAERLFVLLASCEERRYGEWEHQSWWDFSGANNRSAAYQKFMADGLTRSLVAARAREISARTGGYILLQLLIDMSSPGRAADRLLDGPTNDVWIEPWLAHLRSLGVDYRTGTTVRDISCESGRITGVSVSDGAGTHRITADHYVAAVPVEVMRTLLTDEIRQADPHLSDLDRLTVRWMNGIQLYLRRDVPIVHGHCIYIDSPWSLTSISQHQFWDGVDMSQLGDGTVAGILSVDISSWDQNGHNGKKAMECHADEIFEEVWAELDEALNHDGNPVLRGEDVVRWFIDPDVTFPALQAAAGVRTDVNAEPLLINTRGSWAHRPAAATAIENLYLAADYVRTYTDLATMEGANEAARRAVNAILDRSGSADDRCEVWPLHEPAAFAPLRAADRLRWIRVEGHRPPGGWAGPPDPGT